MNISGLDNYTKHFSDNIEQTSLRQGEKFKTYQSKIMKKHLNKNKEGFGSLFDDSQNILKQTALSAEDNTLLQQYYTNFNKKLNDYQSLVAQIEGTSNDYFSRVNIGNPYLNKTIHFTSGEFAYVNNQGVVELIPDKSTWNSSGAPTDYVEVNIPIPTGFSTPGTIVPTTPPLISGTALHPNQVVGNEGNNVYVNTMVSSNVNEKYLGCYKDNGSMTFVNGAPPADGTLSSDANAYSYNDCNNAAINGGYQYFALQNINSISGKGYCGVTNDLTNATNLGKSTVPSQTVMLWKSNTNGTDKGVSASLTNQGSLVVFNGSAAHIFSTTGTEATPSNYYGCYADDATTPAMSYKSSNANNYESCYNEAETKNMSYFGLQGLDATGKSTCYMTNDLSSARKYGIATNCTNPSGNYYGGGLSNAVYGTVQSSNYFLILQDDGNMVIYRGSGPTDNQGLIWESKTTGQQQDPNSLYTASQGKYGVSYLKNGQVLAPDDFVGNTTGSLYLKMQPDGNLVLYTSQSIDNCSIIGNMRGGNQMGGGVKANALYELSEVGQIRNMGQIGYVGPDSKLYTYPATNISLANNYTILSGRNNQGSDYTDSTGKTISYANATVDSCIATCNSFDDCYGFTFSKNTCYPKNSGISYVGTNADSNTDLFTRNKGIKDPPLGVPNNVNNISSSIYSKYARGGIIPSEGHGLEKATSEQLQQLSDLQNELNAVSQNIQNLTVKIKNSDQIVKNQITINRSPAKYFNDLQNADEQISDLQKDTEQYNQQLEDSKITVLQKNYTYIIWTALAIGLLVITFSIRKRSQ